MSEEIPQQLWPTNAPVMLWPIDMLKINRRYGKLLRCDDPSQTDNPQVIIRQGNGQVFENPEFPWQIL